jgi:hypothetical protein
MVEQKLTFKLVFDKPNHVLTTKFVEGHNIWLAKRPFVVEPSLEPLGNKSGTNNSSVVSGEVGGVVSIWSGWFLGTEREPSNKKSSSVGSK